ncbi:TPA: AsnC family transcriptional regulator [bacterium]|nr:AsnC family transcriptional regulator [bacterium]
MKELEILRILEQDSRIPPEKIATMVDLSKEEVEEKIKELEDKGVIIKYKAIVDWEKASIDEIVYAFIDVKVAPQRDIGFDRVARRIYQFPEVHALYLLSGAYDLEVIVEGKGMKEVAYFVAEKLATLEGVQSTATHFVLKRYKVDGVVVEPAEKDRRLTLTL